MTKSSNFWDNIDYPGIIDTIKGVYSSDGSMSTLLDFERVLDEADLYAHRNWDLGELVDGPEVKRYSVRCIFMWPYKLMPDPRAIKRLAAIGCDTEFAKKTIKVPVEIKNQTDFIAGTRYPKSQEKKVWLVAITIPRDLMDDIKEGSIDLADQTIDLADLDDAYADDLDTEDNAQEDQNAQDAALGGMGAMPGGPL